MRAAPAALFTRECDAILFSANSAAAAQPLPVEVADRCVGSVRAELHDQGF
jgi:hypothetical protein